MANSADSDQIALKEYLIHICTVGKGILDATSTFGHMEKKHSFRPTAPAEMVCSGTQDTLFFVKDGLKITPYSMHLHL